MVTKHTVKVPKRVFRRKWLFLLPGTEWMVKAVEQRGKRQTAYYTLSCGEFEIERQEWQLKALNDRTRKASAA